MSKVKRKSVKRKHQVDDEVEELEELGDLDEVDEEMEDELSLDDVLFFGGSKVWWLFGWYDSVDTRAWL